MTLHAAHNADAAVSITTPILINELIAEDTFRLTIVSPEIASAVRPGQFVMLRLAGVTAPLIGRALAVYDVGLDDDGAPVTIDLVYAAKGAMTVPLSNAPAGVMVSLWGPLGNGFDPRPCDHLILAAGGIGQTPMLMAGTAALRDGWANRVTLIYGARRAALLAGLDDFRVAGFDVRICTDDGSGGRAARVPDLLAEHFSASSAIGTRVLTCGPEIMMQSVAQMCVEAGVDCQVSMETPMACGIGICYSCVAKVALAGGGWDYKRTCVEGPIFNADQMVWS